MIDPGSIDWSRYGGGNFPFQLRQRPGSNNALGSVTVLLIPVEVALIVFAKIGFAQGWNVEIEVSQEEAEKRGSKPVAVGPSSAASA